MLTNKKLEETNQKKLTVSGLKKTLTTVLYEGVMLVR